MSSMAEYTAYQKNLRIAGAVILGIFVGFFLFLIVALIIGAVNDSLGTNIPIDMLFAENIWSAILLIAIIGFCIGVFCWRVLASQPTPTEFEIPETIDKF
jgi:H+/Cl- antiporter ClcA